MSIRVHEMEVFLGRADRAVLVRIVATKGSTPREADAFILVSATESLGTIGGGQLEFSAIDNARRMLRNGESVHTIDVQLGPEIGQCCGGRVKLFFQILDGPIAADLTDGVMAAQAAEPRVYVFGAGHVGRALACNLALLPFKTTLIDTRPDELAGLPTLIDARAIALPETVVREAEGNSAFVVLTHDHALDFLIVREALLRGDAAYVGMIGSKTKRAQFKNWFLGEGGEKTQLRGLTCPIGGSAYEDKRPEIIAALTCAELVGELAQKDSRNAQTSATTDRHVGVFDGE